MTTPTIPEIQPHIWARNTDHALPGAVIRLGRRDLFIAHESLPAAIARLQAIHALNA